MDDGVDIHLKSWKDEERAPKAVLQLVHGMAEHIERYSHFAKFLVEKGFIVYGNDHRGHGLTGERMGTLGFFADENGFDRVVNDLYSINRVIQTENPGIPIFLLGHSLGSFLVRRYIQCYSETIQGVILSGTRGNPGWAGKIGKLIAKIEIRTKGAKTPSPLLSLLSFGSFNKGIDKPRTEFDWLTRNDIIVDDYIQDPLCGFICSSGFFLDLFSGLEKIHDSESIKKIRKNLPILIFSGEKDPVGDNLSGVKKVVSQYKQNGLLNLETCFFENARHEMLNEINREEVYDLVLHWLIKQIQAR